MGVREPDLSYLLDTHVWIWSQLTPEKLGPDTQRLLLDSQQSLYISTVSTLELSRLREAGRVSLSVTIEDWIRISSQALDLRTIELSHAHSIESYSLPPEFHKDPADRMLVATARVEALTLITADQRILDYDHVGTYDARL